MAVKAVCRESSALDVAQAGLHGPARLRAARTARENGCSRAVETRSVLVSFLSSVLLGEAVIFSGWHRLSK
jgi:hypothetical protein